MLNADFDLNLLKVFDAVMQTGSVSAAGRRLSVTSSAVSHALGRLRRALGDELFILTAGGMMPTARARELYPEIREALTRIASAFSRDSPSASTLVRKLQLAVSDYASRIALSPLVEVVQRRSPHITVDVATCSTAAMLELLSERRILLAIGQFPTLDESFNRMTVLTDELVIATRLDHPLAQGELTWERARAFQRVRVLADEETSHWSSKAEQAPVTVPNYAAIAALLEKSEMIAIGPRRLVELVPHRLAALTPAGLPRPYTLEAIWRREDEVDPVLQLLTLSISQYVSTHQK